MTDAVRWLSYDEISSELGIERESARQLAIRKRWARQKGNDGKARVGVPEAEFQSRTADTTSQAPSDDPAHDTSVIQVLTRHISRLEEEIETMKKERQEDRNRVDVLTKEIGLERLRAAQVDALQTVIDIERKRTEDLRAEKDGIRADRDRWAAQAERLAVVERRGFFGWLKRA